MNKALVAGLLVAFAAVPLVGASAPANAVAAAPAVDGEFYCPINLPPVTTILCPIVHDLCDKTGLCEADQR